MAHVLICGYYGFGNLGDELLLEAITDQVRRADPRGRITVLSSNPAQTEARFGVRAVHRTMPGAVSQAMRECDLLLFGGGTLLQDATSRRSLWYYLSILSLARRMGKPVMLYAQGIGPISHAADRRRTARLLEAAQAVTLRDDDSAALLREMGVRRELTVTADPVLALADRGEMGEPNQIGWVLHGGLCSKPLLRELGCAMELLNRQGYSSCILPFYPRQDAWAVRPLANHARVISPQQVRTQLGRCGCIISMRLHGLILGGAGDSRVLALSSDPKLSRFVRQMGLPRELNPEDVTAGELADAVITRASPLSPQCLERDLQRLERNWQILRKLLEGR